MAKNGISNHQTGVYIFLVSAHFSPRGIMLRITGIDTGNWHKLAQTFLAENTNAQSQIQRFCQIYTFPYDIFQSFGK